MAQDFSEERTITNGFLDRFLNTGGGLLKRTISGVEGAGKDYAELKIKNQAASTLKNANLNDKYESQEHQNRVAERLKNETDGLIVIHGLGSGKTRTSIQVAEDVGEADVVVPASLRENYKKEVEKFTDDNPASYDIKSYQGASSVKDPHKGKGLLVVDEAHRLRNEGTKQTSAIKDRASEYEKRMLLTGTPIYNRPDDLVNLLRIVSADNSLISHEKFNDTFIGKKKVPVGVVNKVFRGMKDGEEAVMKNQKLFRDSYGKFFDYHKQNDDSGDFPTVSEETHYAKMSDKQNKIYDGVLGKSILALKVRKNLPPDKKESKQLNAFANAVRQVSNSPHNYIEGAEFNLEDAPKLKAVIDNISTDMESNPRQKGLIYSNYLETLSHLSKSLSDAGIENLVYNGNLNDKQKKIIVDRYNDPNDPLNHILVSSAGAEGLDLKGTRTVDVVEPHWNEEKINQVKGRAARYMSHSHLPEEERGVRVRNYFAIPKRKLTQKLTSKKRDSGIDEYLKMLGEKKTFLNNQFIQQIRKSTDDYVNKAASFKLTREGADKFHEELKERIRKSDTVD